MLKELIMLVTPALLALQMMGCSTSLTAIKTKLPEYNEKLSKVYYDNWIETEKELEDLYEVCKEM